MPVCSRCTGIYTGFLLGTIVFPFIKKSRDDIYPSRNFLIMALVPMGLDVGFKWFIGIDSGLMIHALTGLIFSAIFSFYAIPGVMELSDLLTKKGEMRYGKPTQ